MTFWFHLLRVHTASQQEARCWNNFSMESAKIALTAKIPKGHFLEISSHPPLCLPVPQNAKHTGVLVCVGVSAESRAYWGVCAHVVLWSCAAYFDPSHRVQSRTLGDLMQILSCFPCTARRGSLGAAYRVKTASSAPSHFESLFRITHRRQLLFFLGVVFCFNS